VFTAAKKFPGRVASRNSAQLSVSAIRRGRDFILLRFDVFDRKLVSFLFVRERVESKSGVFKAVAPLLTDLWAFWC